MEWARASFLGVILLAGVLVGCSQTPEHANSTAESVTTVPVSITPPRVTSTTLESSTTAGSGFTALIPSRFTAERLGLEEFVLSWEAPPGAVMYEILVYGNVWWESEDTRIEISVPAGVIDVTVVAVSEEGVRSSESAPLTLVHMEGES